MKYNGFISYSHAADGKLAPALQRALHRLAAPLFQLRALHIFRDKENLSASPALWPSIERALADSDYFLLLASPASAQSSWVIREVEWWTANRRIDKQLILVTDGELVWDAAKADFDWTKTTALPQVLGGRYTDEPLWVDLRWAKGGSDLSLRHSRFRAAVLDIAAPLHGKPKEELESDDLLQQRRTKRIRRAAVAALAMLTLVAVIAGILAWQQRGEAIAQRDVARSRQAAAQALRIVSANLDTSLLLSVQASLTADTFDARNALLTSLVHAPGFEFFLHGHRQNVTDVAFSPDGRALASASDDGAVIFWSLDERRALGQPRTTHKAGVVRLAFSPNGRLLASSSRDGTVQLWDATTRQPLGAALAHDDAAGSLAFSGDSTTLASGGFRLVRVWNTDTRANVDLPLPPGHNVVTALTFDAAGRALASGDESGNVARWDLTAPGVPATLAFDSRFTVKTLRFSDSGQLVAIGFSGNNLIRWEVGPERPRVHPFTSKQPILSFDTRATAFNTAADVLAVTVPQRETLIVDVKSTRDREPLEPRETFEELRIGVLTLGMNVSGDRMATGYRDGAIAVWRTTPGHRLARRLSGDHQLDVTAVAFAPDGRRLASAGDDGAIRLWDTSTRLPLGEPLDTRRRGVTGLAFSPSGDRLVSGNEDGAVLLWDLATRRSIELAPGGNSSASAIRVAFSQDGTSIAAANGRLRIWNVQSRQLQAVPGDDPQKLVVSVAFSPDGTTLASGALDGSVMLRDLNGRPRADPIVVDAKRRIDSLAFASDGRTLVSGGDTRLSLWRLQADRTLASPLPLDAIDSPQRRGSGGGVAMTPDGRWIVSGGNNTIVLWDAESRQPLDRVLIGWQGQRTRMALSPDGTVVAASHGTGILLWDVGLDAWRAQACAVANRELTGAEWARFIGSDQPYREVCSGLRSRP